MKFKVNYVACTLAICAGLFGFSLAMLFGPLLAGQSYEALRVENQRLRYTFIRGEQQYFEQTDADQLFANLLKHYATLEEEQSREAFRQLDAEHEIERLRSFVKTVRFAAEQAPESWIAVSESLGELCSWPMITIQEIDAAHENREQFIAEAKELSREKIAAAEAKRDEAEAAYVERIRTFLNERREAYASMSREQKVTYVNMVHIVADYEASTNIGYTKQDDIAQRQRRFADAVEPLLMRS